MCACGASGTTSAYRCRRDLSSMGTARPSTCSSSLWRISASPRAASASCCRGWGTTVPRASSRCGRAARTLGQDEATSVVYGMPRAAWEAGAVERQLPLPAVAAAIAALCARGPGAER